MPAKPDDPQNQMTTSLLTASSCQRLSSCVNKESLMVQLNTLLFFQGRGCAIVLSILPRRHAGPTSSISNIQIRVLHLDRMHTQEIQVQATLSIPLFPPQEESGKTSSNLGLCVLILHI